MKASRAVGNIPGLEDGPKSPIEFKTNYPLKPGCFVAQVIGDSMEPGIPKGAYCLFRKTPMPKLKDQIFLIQHHEISDPDFGGVYTLKRVKLTYRNEDGRRIVSGVKLLSDNPKYEPIKLTLSDENELKIIAEFIHVLMPQDK